ncbi:hypothetical protein LB531_21225 [Mesorhizobium sp. CO1-1-2]|uniref:hypothetical protein n=1 Tax=Mesorhizobium sp. CO1-1-2 TaxID=2876635 RepID=UPI001CCCB905|nr:hypothetical protein [Mesorhizobium sp. CO1-1-2]MBZ9683183.1 hypothetical protein [Mesorhizobium sp. CO1-1-2]
MPPDRLKAREIQGEYQVYDDDDVLGSFASIVEMARFMRERGSRFWLDWGRTVIGGETAPHDFACTFLGSDNVGRIQGEAHGPSAGTWFWTISTHDNRWRKHGGQRGREDTKDMAVAALEREFTDYLANTPSGKSAYAKAKGF